MVRLKAFIARRARERELKRYSKDLPSSLRQNHLEILSIEMDPSDIQVSLTKAASDYSPPRTVLGTLEPFKDAILMLRAKSASYESIAEFLAENGIEISPASIRRFCIRHKSQIKNIRAELSMQKKEQAIAIMEAKPLPIQSTTPLQRPVRDLRGSV